MVQRSHTYIMQQDLVNAYDITSRTERIKWLGKEEVRAPDREEDDHPLISSLSFHFLFLRTLQSPPIHNSAHFILITLLPRPVSIRKMSSSPPSSRIRTPPSDATTRSGRRSRIPVRLPGYVDSSEIHDSQESVEEQEDWQDDDFVETSKGKRSRSSQEDEDDDSQVSLLSYVSSCPRADNSLLRARRKLPDPNPNSSLVESPEAPPNRKRKASQ